MRIVIAEDSVLLRDGLTRLLTESGFEVVAAVPDAEQLLTAVAKQQPDLAVIDVRMPPTHTDEGIRAALVIRRQFPDVALLVLSQYVEESYATDLLSAATSSVGYLLKDRVAQTGDFVDAVRRVAAGGTAGSGLRGLAGRAAAVDGTLAIDSPPGGPTVITAELPCES